MEMMQQNYLDAKFLLDNLKKQKVTILTNPTTFTGFDKIGSAKDVQLKDYYDTPDFFLHECGISININTIKGSKESDLIVRWDGERKRINFLKDMPETFVKRIPSKSSIYSHAEFIADSISAIVPAGLNVDLFQLIGRIMKIFSVKKKREIHNYIQVNGLKLNLYFTDALFFSNIKSKKERVLMLEVTSEMADMEKDYNAFIKKISFNNPTLIRLKDSDLLLGKEYIFGIK